MDDGGFVKLAATLHGMANRLRQLNLYRTRVSPALLSEVLSSLSILAGLTLVGNPIGDDGFQQVASSLQQLSYLKNLHLCDIAVTWQSLSKLEEVLPSCPEVHGCHLYVEKKSFPPPGEDIDKIPSLTTLRFRREKALSEPTVSHGYRVTNRLSFLNARNQVLHLKFYV